MASPTSRSLFRVWGSSATDVWAVGDSVLVHYDGAAWSNVPMVGDLVSMQSGPSAQQSTFQLGLWGSGPNDVYLGGNRGRIARFDGSAWRLMPTPTLARILSISGSATGGAIAIADPQEGFAGPMLLRGVSATGTFAAPFGVPLTWY